MELTCPACSARYAVPTTAIPVSGRLVRCSNCRAEWKAMAATAPAAGGASASAAPAPVPEPAPEPATNKARETPAPFVDDSPAAGATADAAPAAEEPADDSRTSSPLEEAAERPPLAASNPARRQPGAEDAHSLAMSIDDEPEPKGGRGFVWGFALVTLTALAAVAVYARHGAIANAVPQVAQLLDQYVALVDTGRVALADAVARFLPDA